MKSRKRSHKYFDDGGVEMEPATTADELPCTSIGSSKNYLKEAEEQKSVKHQGNELFQKQFEATFGYVKGSNRDRRQNHFTKQQKHFRWHEEEKMETNSAVEVVRNDNWTEGRQGVSESDCIANGSFDIPELSQSFPNDLVSYLRSIANNLKNVNSDAVKLMKEKCFEECKENEVLLLRFESSCRVVEEIFNGCEFAANSFHAAIVALPGTLPIDAILTGCSCRTLETFLFALSTTKDQQIFVKWTEIILKYWDKLVDDRNSSHFLRSFFRSLVGLPKSKTEQSDNIDVNMKLRQQFIKEFNANVVIKKCFCSLVEMALDFQKMKKVVECEWLVKGEKRKDFIMQSVDEPNEVLKLCRSKFGSHFWQTLVKRADEETKELLYNAVISTNLSELAQDQYGTYVVDTLVGTASSEELIASIFEELWDAVVELCDKGKWTVVLGLIRASIEHEDKQKELIKKIRRCFFCAKKSEKNLLVPKIFTMQTAQLEIKENGKIEFDVRFGDYSGSKLLQELMNLKHNRTVVSSLKSLTEKTLLNLALNDKGTFIIQTFLNSTCISLDDKLCVVNILKRNWMQLIGDRFGSYVFDVLWNSGTFNIGEKRAIMLKLCAEYTEGKSGKWRMMVKKLNVQGFKENRKGWMKTEESRMRSQKRAVAVGATVKTNV